MEKHLHILGRAGKVLIGIGILYLLYSFYSSQGVIDIGGIPVILGGIFLLKGNPLGAARVIAWIAAFVFVGCVILMILLPFSQPFDLTLTQFRLYPLEMIFLLLWFLAGCGLAYWVYRQTRSAPVLEACAAKGLVTATPKAAFCLGALFPVLGIGFLLFFQKGETGARAVQLARQQYGTQYKYHMTGFTMTTSHVRAKLTAYNNQEVGAVQVEWER